MSLGPEQVEEESGSKDCGDVNSNEYIVRSDADKVIVMDSGRAMQCLDDILLFDIVW